MTDRTSPRLTNPAARVEPREDGEWIDTMLAHITLGVAKADSWTVRDAYTSGVWDGMARDVAGIRARGQQVAFRVDGD